jgi:hypothetical protein
MKISKIHAALTSDRHPQSYLGPNYKDVLNFWLWLDSFKLKDFQTLSAIRHLYDYDRTCYLDLYVSQQGLDYVKIRNAVYNVVPFVNKCYSARSKVIYATFETISSHKLIEKRQSFHYLPMFEDL